MNDRNISLVINQSNMSFIAVNVCTTNLTQDYIHIRSVSHSKAEQLLILTQFS